MLGRKIKGATAEFLDRKKAKTACATLRGYADEPTGIVGGGNGKAARLAGRKVSVGAARAAGLLGAFAPVALAVGGAAWWIGSQVNKNMEEYRESVELINKLSSSAYSANVFLKEGTSAEGRW